MWNHPGTLRTLCRSGAATAACLLAVGSVAQDTGAGNAQGEVVIEEVVVTAQKRAENLQDVPVSVTALTSEDLEVSRLRNLNELADLVPNMQELPLKGDGTPVFSLRGLSMGDYSFHQQSPIGMYVDEVYKGNQALNAVPHFDLERVEVLRGPQGTLYGKNTTGGAVNFITRRPEMENAHYVTIGAGNFGLLEAHGAFNAVLSDTFAIRLAGTYGTADGWFENVNPGVDDAYSTDSRAVRLSALWQPRDDVEVLLRAQSGKSNPVNWAVKVFTEQPPVWFGVYDLYNAFGGSLPAPTQAGLGYHQTNTEQDTRRLIDSDTVSVRVDWDVDERFVLTSITSWGDGAAFNPDESDGMLNRANANELGVEANQVTQDLRLTSNLEGPFDFVTGLYYYSDSLDASNRIGLFLDVDFNLDGAVDFNDCLDPLAVAFGFPPSAAGAATEGLFNSLGFSLAGFATLGCYSTNSFTQERDSWAAYFDGSYEMSDALTLRFGIRYTDDESRQSDFNAHMAGPDYVPVLGTINGGAADPLATVAGQSFDDQELTGRVGLDYTFDNGTMIYGSFNRGYRSGAYNGQAYYSLAERNWVAPERLEGFEVGLKTLLWGGRARLNLSGFSYTYEDQQYIDIDALTFQQTLRNIDSSETSGAEIEFAAQVTPTLLLSAGVGLLDATIEKGMLSGVDVAGEKLLTAPDRNVNVAASWDAYTGRAGRLTLYADVMYRSDSTSGVGNAEGNGHSRWNGRASFTGNTERWTVSVWGRNLGDEEYTNFYIDLREEIGVIAGLLGAPRTYGAEVTLRF